MNNEANYQGSIERNESRLVNERNTQSNFEEYYKMIPSPYSPNTMQNNNGIYSNSIKQNNLIKKGNSSQMTSGISSMLTSVNQKSTNNLNNKLSQNYMTTNHNSISSSTDYNKLNYYPTNYKP
jgi:hypothetical protein